MVDQALDSSARGFHQTAGRRNRVGWLPELPAGLSVGARAYVAQVALWADADGDATVMRRTLAAELGKSTRQVTRYHAEAEVAGVVARIDGGHRGAWQTIRLTCRRGMDQVARASRWVILRRQRARAREAAKARAQLSARKGDTGVSSITPTVMDGAAVPSITRQKCNFQASPDIAGWCICGMPAANARHS